MTGVLAPPILHELFAIPDGLDERPWANAMVDSATLRDAVAGAIAGVLPDAVVVAPLHLARGRVDVAVLTPEVTLGILLEPSDPFDAQPKSGIGADSFDLAVAIAAYPKDVFLEAKPRHVWGVRAYLGRAGDVEFTLERPATAAPEDTAARILRLLCNRDLARVAVALSASAQSPAELRAELAATLTPSQARALVARTLARESRQRRIVDGATVADALARSLAERYAPAAIVREFAYRGSIADVAVLAPDGLHLYEIKGETDCSTRLRLQVPAYQAVASTCTLVTTCNHRTFRAHVPDHWGLMEAARERGIRFLSLREAAPNPHREAGHVAKLLDPPALRRLVRKLAKYEETDDATIARAALHALALRLTFAYRMGSRGNLALASRLDAWNIV